jgi:hypothetical protein
MFDCRGRNEVETSKRDRTLKEIYPNWKAVG